MPRMANESRLNKRQLAEFQAWLERWLAELRVAAGQMTREGRELVMNPHWMSPSCCQ
jgi:hypothetical protein